jgi:hypothetical protein
MESPTHLAPNQSGQQCSFGGLYLSYGCEHVNRIELEIGETFPVCNTCQELILWTLQPNHDAGVRAIQPQPLA